MIGKTASQPKRKRQGRRGRGGWGGRYIGRREQQDKEEDYRESRVMLLRALKVTRLGRLR